MRTVRSRMRPLLDLRQIAIGDYIILVSSLLTLVSLFLPWFRTSITHPHDEWAFTYSEVASIVVILFFLLTLFLVIYPAISPETGAPPLPFATPPVFLIIGAVLLLLFTYELGKYACIQCAPGTSRGIGVYVAFIAALVYLVGAVIKWGSRPVRRHAAGA